MSQKIFSSGLFSTTLGAELVTEVLKSFLLDMTVQEAQLRHSVQNGTEEDPEHAKHELEVFNDVLHATGELILEVNKYREKPESKMELLYDLIIGDDERYGDNK